MTFIKDKPTAPIRRIGWFKNLKSPNGKRMPVKEISRFRIPLFY